MSVNQQTRGSGCRESERTALMTGYPDNHCLVTRYPDNRYETRNLTVQSPKSKNLRKITYEIISELCKTNPILSAVGGLQMNVSIYLQKDYENKWQQRVRKNKPKTNPNKPNFETTLIGFSKAHRYLANGRVSGTTFICVVNL